MTATPTGLGGRRCKAGDVLSASRRTYDTRRRRGTSRWAIMPSMWSTTGADGRRPVHRDRRRRGRAHPRPPAREQQPRREAAPLPDPRELLARPGRERGAVAICSFVYAPGRPHATGQRGARRRPPGPALTFDNRDADAPNVCHSITACKAPCNRRPASPTRSPTATSTSTPASSASARPARRRRQPRHLEHADDLRRRHLHLLLPRPPLHARRVQGQGASIGAVARGPSVRPIPGSVRCAADSADPPVHAPARERPVLISRGYARAILAVHPVVPVAWIALLVAATLTLPSLGSAGSAPLEDLVAVDSRALVAPERSPCSSPRRSRRTPSSSSVTPPGSARTARRFAAAAGRRRRAGGRRRWRPPRRWRTTRMGRLRRSQEGTTALAVLAFDDGRNLEERRAAAVLVRERLRVRLGLAAEHTGAAPRGSRSTMRSQDALPLVEAARHRPADPAHRRARTSARGAPLMTLSAAGIAYLSRSACCRRSANGRASTIPRRSSPSLMVLLLGLVADYSVFFLSALAARLPGAAELARGARSAPPRAARVVLHRGRDRRRRHGAHAVGRLGVLPRLRTRAGDHHADRASPSRHALPGAAGPRRPWSVASAPARRDEPVPHDVPAHLSVRARGACRAPARRARARAPARWPAAHGPRAHAARAADDGHVPRRRIRDRADRHVRHGRWPRDRRRAASCSRLARRSSPSCVRLGLGLLVTRVPRCRRTSPVRSRATRRRAGFRARHDSRPRVDPRARRRRCAPRRRRARWWPRSARAGRGGGAGPAEQGAARRRRRHLSRRRRRRAVCGRCSTASPGLDRITPSTDSSAAAVAGRLPRPRLRAWARRPPAPVPVRRGPGAGDRGGRRHRRRRGRRPEADRLVALAREPHPAADLPARARRAAVPGRGERARARARASG